MSQRDDEKQPDSDHDYRIHLICNEFEEHWRIDNDHLIEEFLDRDSDVNQEELLRELLRIELYLMCDNDIHPEFDEYVSRFGKYSRAVVNAFLWAAGEFSDKVQLPTDRYAKNLKPNGDGGEVFWDHTLLAISMARKLKLITTLQLDRALSQWADSPTKSFFDVLVDQRVLNVEGVENLRFLVGQFIERNSQPRAKTDEDNEDDIHSTEDILSVLPGRRFSVIKFLEGGGQGRVSVAFDMECKRKVAFKEIREDFAKESAYQEQFLNEAEITARLEHPGIVPVYSLGRHSDGRPYYAMRYIRGENLLQAIERHYENKWNNKAEQRVSFRHLIARFVDVCHAVEYAHSRGILHRDLKPANIVLGKFGETLVVDWGLADSYPPSESPDLGKSGDLSLELPIKPSSGSASSNLVPGRPIGTPSYMSPEQAEGRLDEITVATDVYSLGATLYQILAGAAPFRGSRSEVIESVRKGEFPDPSSIVETTPVMLEKICLKAMANSVAERFGQVRDLAQEVQDWLDNEPMRALSASVEYFERLVAEKPDEVEYRRRFAREALSFACCLQTMDRLDEADAFFVRAIDIYRELHEHNTTDVSAVQDLILARSQFAGLCKLQGESDKARGLERENRELFQSMAKRVRTSRQREEFHNMSAHHGFSTEEVEKMLMEHAMQEDEEPDRDTGTQTLWLASSPSQSPVHGWEDSGVKTVHPFEPDSSSLSQQESSQEMFRESWGIEETDRYEIIKVIAQGGLGEVFCALDRFTNSLVAIKTVVSQYGPQGQRRPMLGTMRGEAILLANLNHPNVIRTKNVGFQKDTGREYLVMDYVGTDTLDSVTNERQKIDNESQMVMRELVELVAQVGDGIQHAHEKGVLHADPKPSNILVSSKGKAVLTDWGLSHVFDLDRWRDSMLTVENRPDTEQGLPMRVDRMLIGTPAYMAPEQVKGELQDERTDVFMLGGTLFYALTSDVPRQMRGAAEIFKSIDEPIRDVRTLNGEVDSELGEIVQRALAIQREDRYPTASQLVDDLRAWLGS